VLLLCSAFSAQTKKNTKLSYQNLGDSILHYQSKNAEKATAWIDQYFSKARSENNTLEEGNAWKYAVNTAYYAKEIAKARRLTEDYFSWAKNAGNPEVLANAYLVLGEIQLMSKESKQALSNMYKALEISNKLKESNLQELVLSKISAFLYISGEYQEANRIRRKILLVYENKPLDSAFSKKDRGIKLIYTHAALAGAYRKLNEMDSAIICEHNIKKYLKDVDSCTKAIYYLMQAERFYDQKRFKEAKPLYQKSHEMCPAELPLMQLNYDYQTGKVELGLKNYSEAIRILQGGLDAYQVLPQEEGFMDDYYKLLANAYKETGNFEKANFYFEKHIVSSAEFSQLKGDASNAFRDKAMKEFSAELLKMEEDRKSQSRFLNFILAISSLFILALLLILLRFYRIRKKNEIRFEELLSKLNSPNTLIVDSKDVALEELSTNDVAPEITHQILVGLKELETKLYFLNSDCNSYNVAKKIKTNTTYLSKVVNQEFEKNFNTYINDLRVNYAIVKLKEDKKFRSFSIQSIAEELGYKSADSFTKYFKIHTGLNPSFYIKQLNSL